MDRQLPIITIRVIVQNSYSVLKVEGGAETATESPKPYNPVTKEAKLILEVPQNTLPPSPFQKEYSLIAQTTSTKAGV